MDQLNPTTEPADSSPGNASDPTRATSASSRNPQTPAPDTKESKQSDVFARIRELIAREGIARRQRAREIATQSPSSAQRPKTSVSVGKNTVQARKARRASPGQSHPSDADPCDLKLWFDTPGDIVARRIKLGLSQAEFWGSILVGQGTGCRYERGVHIPTAIKMLLQIAYGSQKQGDGLVDSLRQGKFRGSPARQRIRRKRANGDAG